MVKGDIPSVPSAMATLMLPIMAIIKTEQRAGKCCNDVYIFLFMCVLCGKDKKEEAQQGTENEPVLRPRKESVYFTITLVITLVISVRHSLSQDSASALT